MRAALLLLAATGLPAAADDPAGPVFVRHDSQVAKAEPGPHDGTGETTAYRYFDPVPQAGLIFRKRALHPDASIGVHVLRHDEVYYVLSGRGELTVGDVRREVGPDTAIFLRLGTPVGIRQLGDEDLVIIIAYPPFEDTAP